MPQISWKRYLKNIGPRFERGSPTNENRKTRLTCGDLDSADADHLFEK